MRRWLTQKFCVAGNKRWGRTGRDIAKRLFDLTLAIPLLVLCLPGFFLIALLIRRDSPGPAFFKHLRVGRDGRPFRMYKFRTMHVDTAPYSVAPTHPHDPRITRLGRFLRATALDELPQLLNVLTGDMSLVGPRPEMPFIVEREYGAVHHQRLRVRPGITGLWQLSPGRGRPIHAHIEYDLEYLQRQSLWLDAHILARTAAFAVQAIKEARNGHNGTGSQHDAPHDKVEGLKKSHPKAE